MLSPVVTRARPARGPVTGLVSLIRALYERGRHLVSEAGKFGIVGAFCYGIDVATYALCLTRFNTFVALTISTAVSTSCAFVGNRFWTWRDAPRTSLHRAYSLYFGFNLVGLGISFACLFLSHTVLGSFWSVLQSPAADIVAGKVVGVGFASLFRFWAYRRFVFGSGAPDA